MAPEDDQAAHARALPVPDFVIAPDMRGTVGIIYKEVVNGRD